MKKRTTKTRKGERTARTTISPTDIAALRQLQTKSNSKRRALLLNADGRLLRLLSDCCLNFLQQTFSVPSQKLGKLRKHKQVIRKLAKARVPLKTRRRAFIQHGGFLPLLLPAAISFLSNILLRR